MATAPPAPVAEAIVPPDGFRSATVNGEAVPGVTVSDTSWLASMSIVNVSVSPRADLT